MLEYTISGETYQFNAGFAFIREIQPIRKDEKGEPVGLMWAMAGIIDRNPERLRDALLAMNVGQTPRVTQDALEAWIESHEDLESVYERVDDFFMNANCTATERKRLQVLMELAKASKQ